MRSHARWDRPGWKNCPSGKELKLGLQRFEKEEVIGVEFVVRTEYVSDPPGPAIEPMTHKLVLAAADNNETGKPWSWKLKDTSHIQEHGSSSTTSLSATAPGDPLEEPFIKVLVGSWPRNKKWRQISGAEAHIPMAWAHCDDDKSTRLEVDWRICRGDAFTDEIEAGGFEFLGRTMTPARKLREFLEWQSGLIYGPTRTLYRERDRAYVNLPTLWGEISGPPTKRYLRVSATGKTTNSACCSPMVAVFLGYWFNYHGDLQTSEAGGSKEALATHYADFVYVVPPVCTETHKWDWWIGNKDLRKDAKHATKKRTPTQLNGKTDKKRRKDDTCYIVDGSGDLDKLLLPKGKMLRRALRLSPTSSMKAVQDGDIVLGNKKGWKLLYRKPAETCPSQKASNRRWHWSAFYHFLETERQATPPRVTPGDLFMCASGYHAWLVAVLGPGFNVPRRLIFGDGVASRNAECDLSLPDEPTRTTGYFMIQASGPGPSSVLYKKYRRFGAKLDGERPVRQAHEEDGYKPSLERAINGWEGNTTRSPTGKTFDELFSQLDGKITSVENGEAAKSTVTEAQVKPKGLWVFNGTPLTAMNGRIREAIAPEPGVITLDYSLGVDVAPFPMIKSYEKPKKRGTDFDKFQVWKVRRALVEDSSEGHLGWVQADLDPPLAVAPAKLPERDCRPLARFNT